METNKRQHFISLLILPLLLSCSGEKKDSTQTETVSNKAIVRVETVSAQDVEQISELQQQSRPTSRITSPRKPRCA